MGASPAVMHGTPLLEPMIQSGARGYLRKNTSPLELISAIESVHRGELVFKPEVVSSARLVIVDFSG